jgi:diguanylate cyclase (GGDEF)-like protein
MSTNALDIAQLTDNITQQNELLGLQNQILDEIVKSSQSSQNLLNDLCRCAEALVPNALASIMLFDESQHALSVKAAPNIPQPVINDLQGLKPAPDGGSCGNAVFTGEATYVCNTQIDEHWSGLRNLASKYHIAACWSQPIFYHDAQAIGSFALSSFETREPSEFQKNVLQVCSNLVSIILHRKEQEEKLWQIAHHDALTGLPNRHFVESQIQHAISNASRNQNCMALMFIDMDNFKDINDSYGHDFGDEVLLCAMTLLKTCLRKEDIVARHGGDEFLLILENLKDKMAIEVIAEKIQHNFHNPMEINERKVAVHFSIGISLYPDDGQSSSELMKNADIAMYQAKAAGKNSIQYFRKELGEKILQKVQLEQEIREGLNRDEFELYFQPQYVADSADFESLEMLLRWNHPQRGFLLPGVFIPVAEQSQLINELSQYAFTKACRQAVDWINRGYQIPKISLNLSVAQLKTGFSEWLAHLLLETQLSAQLIELEITETLLMKRGNEGIIELNKLREMGISLAMDDFGTGYSSLSQLKTLPIDKLKIDRSFIMHLDQDESDQTIVKTIITLGKNLGMRIVAEGVENESQQNILLQLGCDMIQGFYRYKPANAQHIELILKRAPFESASS